MSIRALRALRTVSDLRSFTDAAKALNLSPSAISMQIGSLEETLGVVLFDRRRRPPRLTKAGETVLRYAQPIVEQYDVMVSKIIEVESDRQYFRLGAIPSALLSLATAALMKLREDHPGLVISVTSSLSGDLLRMVNSGEIDAALMHRPKEIDARFDWHHVCKQSLVIVCPPDCRLKTPAAIFDRYPYIRFNRSAWVAPMIERRFSDLGISPDMTAEVESLEAIHRMVALGFGVSVVPDIRAQSAAKADFKVLAFGTPVLFRSIGLLSRKSMSKRRARSTISDSFDRLIAKR
jgi:DNA-binding transcriptional LysR family regulator